MFWIFLLGLHLWLKVWVWCPFPVSHCWADWLPCPATGGFSLWFVAAKRSEKCRNPSTSFAQSPKGKPGGTEVQGTSISYNWNVWKYVGFDHVSNEYWKFLRALILKELTNDNAQGCSRNIVDGSKLKIFVLPADIHWTNQLKFLQCKLAACRGGEGGSKGRHCGATLGKLLWGAEQAGGQPSRKNKSICEKVKEAIMSSFDWFSLKRRWKSDDTFDQYVLYSHIWSLWHHTNQNSSKKQENQWLIFTN